MLCSNCDAEMRETYHAYEWFCKRCEILFDSWTGTEITVGDDIKPAKHCGGCGKELYEMQYEYGLYHCSACHRYEDHIMGQYWSFSTLEKDEN